MGKGTQAEMPGQGRIAAGMRLHVAHCCRDAPARRALLLAGLLQCCIAAERLCFSPKTTKRGAFGKKRVIGINFGRIKQQS